LKHIPLNHSSRSRCCHPTRIGLLTPYSGTNLGDGAIQTAAIEGIRRHLPDSEICGITLYPVDTTRRHGIPAFPITGLLVNFYSEGLFRTMDGLFVRFNEEFAYSENTSKEGSADQVPVRRVDGAWRIIKSIPLLGSMAKVLLQIIRTISLVVHEIWHIGISYRFVKKLDMVVVSGGGQLDEAWGGPWGHPYALLRWAILSRLTGKKFVVLSVGVGDLKTLLSRFFTRGALALACYRSYRDQGSKRMVGKWAFTRKDACVPDLAFGLRLPEYDPLPPDGRKSKTVGISPIAFGHVTAWPQPMPEIYQKYLSNMMGFIATLRGKGYRVVFFKSSGADRLALQDLQERIAQDGTDGLGAGISAPDVEILGRLLHHVGKVDFVVASRLHSVMLSHILRKPVLAISFERKVDAHMQDMKQEKYVVDIRDFSASDLVTRFEELVRDAEYVKTEISRQILSCQSSLEKQYLELFQR
jgi:polysaccharide pyruvyl transferase WcaK-like protein